MLGGAQFLNSMIFGTMMLSGFAHGKDVVQVPQDQQPAVMQPPGPAAPSDANPTAQKQDNLGQKVEDLTNAAGNVAQRTLAGASGLAGNVLAGAQSFLGNILGPKQPAQNVQNMPQQTVQEVTTTTTSQTTGQPTGQGNVVKQDAISKMLQQHIPDMTNGADFSKTREDFMQKLRMMRGDREMVQATQPGQSSNFVINSTQTVTNSHPGSTVKQSFSMNNVTGPGEKFTPGATRKEPFPPLQDLFGKLGDFANRAKASAAGAFQNVQNSVTQNAHAAKSQQPSPTESQTVVQTVTKAATPFQQVVAQTVSPQTEKVVQTKTVTKTTTTQQTQTPAPVKETAEVIVQTQAAPAPAATSTNP